MKEAWKETIAMTHVSPTVLDVAHAVAELNEVATSMHDGDATNRVASNLAYQLSRHNDWNNHKTTSRDVRVALIVHGASPLVVEQYPRTLAARIRADFSDGWDYHKGHTVLSQSKREPCNCTPGKCAGLHDFDL